MVLCDNRHDCTATSAVPDAPALIQITRQADWDALPLIVLDLARAGFDGMTVDLVLQPADRRAHSTPGRRARTRFTFHRLAAGRFGMPPDERLSLLLAARNARTAQFRHRDGRIIAAVLLNGLEAALNRFDHVQARTDTVTGIYTRGEILVPLAAIMPPPLPVQVRESGLEEANRELGTQAFRMICGIGAPRHSGDAVVWRMAGGKRIVAVDCGSEALNGGRIWLVVDETGQLDLAHFPQPDLAAQDGTDGFLPNSWFDHAAGQIHSMELGRPDGDCGSSLTWQWTAEGFQLAEARRMPLCIGLAQDLWPRTWTTAFTP